MLEVADWGSRNRPFQLEGKKPLIHLRGHSQTNDNLWSCAGQHEGFYGWLRVANRRIASKLRVGLLDLPDRLWRDQYEERVHPGEAADTAMEEEAEELGLDVP